MREMAKETDLQVVSGAYWDGLGGLTPEAEEPVDEEYGDESTMIVFSFHGQR